MFAIYHSFSWSLNPVISYYYYFQHSSYAITFLSFKLTVFFNEFFFKLQIVTIHELYPVSGLHPIFSINTCLLTAHIYLYIYLFIYFCQWVCEKIAKISTKNNRPIIPQLPGINMKICRTKGNKTVDNVLTGGTCRQPTSGVLNWERWVVSSSMCAGNHPTVHNISSTVCFSLGRI